MTEVRRQIRGVLIGHVALGLVLVVARLRFYQELTLCLLLFLAALILANTYLLVGLKRCSNDPASTQRCWQRYFAIINVGIVAVILGCVLLHDSRRHLE